MPSKRSELYEDYERRKMCYYLAKLTANYAEVGRFFNNKYADIHAKAVDAYTLYSDKTSDGLIAGISFTDMVVDAKYSPMLNELIASIDQIEKNAKKYEGPFKEYMVAGNYVNNPQNGDIFEAIMDNPSLERIISTFADGPVFTSVVKENGNSRKVMDIEINKKREEALGEFGPLYTEYYMALADYVKVIFERQKAEALGKTGLDSDYAKKYSRAIDILVDKYDKLRIASEKRYKRNDLSQREKDLHYFPGTGDCILNNEISEITSADPNKKSRNTVWTAVENLRAQSKAIKNGWPVKDAIIMGLVAEAKFNTDEDLKCSKLDIAAKKAEIEKQKNMKVKPEESEKSAKQLKKLQSEYEQLLENDKLCEEAAKESYAIYKKYTDMKDPDYFFRRDALKEINGFANKYEESGNLIYTKNLCDAVNINTKDPFDFEGKTRAEQAKIILKSLDDVDEFMRSSANFKDLKNSVRKMVEIAEKYPNMNEIQFKEYQSQVIKVRRKAQIYLRGKRTEEREYKKNHKNAKLKRSEYTSKRINAVGLIEDKLYAHMALTSDSFTKGFSGTAHDRALGKYERIIKLKETVRMKKLGKNVMYETEGGESIDASEEYTSFLKSVYVEKMRERYEYDPDFTAKDFLDSLKTKNILKGSEELRIKMHEYPDFLDHIKEVLRLRINVATDSMEEVYDSSMYVIDDPIPDGIGQEWVRYEMKNFRVKYGIPEPSKNDYVNDNKSEIEEKESVVEDDKASVEKVSEKAPAKNLAGMVYDALASDELLRYSTDPLYLEIAKDFEKHSYEEEPGKNTKISNSTMMKMARYIDKAYDKLKYKEILSEDDVTRRVIVESAFAKYSQKPEMFEKSVGEFEPNPPVYNPVFGYNHGEGLYKPLFYKMLDLSAVNIGKKYIEDPDNAQLAEDVLNKAYQIIMVNVVEKTTADEKGVPYDVINKAFDATSNKKQIGLFIKEKITSIKFKQTYEKLVLGAAKEGKLGIDAALEACDKALVITLEEYEKNKDITNESNIKIMAENLHRKIKSVTISQNKATDKKATGKKVTGKKATGKKATDKKATGKKV